MTITDFCEFVAAFRDLLPVSNSCIAGLNTPACSDSQSATLVPRVIMLRLLCKDSASEGVTIDSNHPIVQHSIVLRDVVVLCSDHDPTFPERDTDHGPIVCHVPVTSISETLMSMILWFAEYHKDVPYSNVPKPLPSGNIRDFCCQYDADFFEDMEQETVFEVILAANVLSYQPLLDLSCACVASMIKGKSPEEIRQTFNIVNDFTPEEEAQVREENKWCEEA